MEKLILEQDVIFVGGGNTKSMLAVWKEWGLDKLLKKAYQNGVIMSGVSAGAICWFEKGITDSWGHELKMLDCMGFTKGNCCPHYDEEVARKPALSKFIKNKIISDCYAIDGGCALHIKNDETYSAISFKGNKNSYFVEYKDPNIIENTLSVKNINEKMEYK